jgi:sigma-B regulation protein RsbU (phosphoserine phosphatase)
MLDSSTGVRRLTLASGGHHLPLRRSSDGMFDRLGRPGAILGMLAVPEAHDTDVALAAGDMVVLFTDGVIEARRQGELFEEDRLRAVVDRSAALGASAVADAVVAAALDFEGGRSRDDMAVVVIRVPPIDTGADSQAAG